MAKVRFVFGKDMSDEQMWEAFKKMAKECGIKCKDSRKKKVPKKNAKRDPEKW
jgi:hypothetical protein